MANVYTKAVSNSNPSWRKKPTDNSRGDTIIDGINYGHNWTSGDQAVYDLYLKSLEYDTNMEFWQKNYDAEREARDYNSPANQAQRMREAGVNPDLIGVDNVAGGSPTLSPMSSPAAPVGQTPQDLRLQKTNQAVGIAQTILEAIPAGIQLYTSSKSALQGIESNELGMRDRIKNDALDFLGGYIDTDYLNPRDDKDYPHPPILSDPFVSDYASKRYGNSKRGMRRQKQFNDALYTLVMGNREELRNAVYSRKFQSENSRSGFLGLLSQYGWNADDRVMVDIIKELNTFKGEMEKYMSKFNKDYYSTANGSTKGTSENSSWKRSQTLYDNSPLANLFSSADKYLNSDKRGDSIKGCILYAVALFMQIKFGSLN